VEGCDRRTAQNLSSWGSETPLQIRWIFYKVDNLFCFHSNFIINEIFVVGTMLLWSVIAHAQDEQHLLDFEKKIEAAVVAADLSFLQKAYADDFRFKHGTGHIDTKATWLKDVEKNKGKFVSRT
jgi:hypothetical protein